MTGSIMQLQQMHTVFNIMKRKVKNLKQEAAQPAVYLIVILRIAQTPFVFNKKM